MTHFSVFTLSTSNSFLDIIIISTTIYCCFFSGDDAVAGSLCLLRQSRGNAGNWGEVLNHWTVTSEYRMYTLVHGSESDDDDNKDTQEINDGGRSRKAFGFLARYPVFEDASAYKLVNILLFFVLFGCSSNCLRSVEILKRYYFFMFQHLVIFLGLSLLQFEIDFATLHPDIDSLVLFKEWANLSLFVTQQIQIQEPDFLEDTTLTSGS